MSTLPPRLVANRKSLLEIETTLNSGSVEEIEAGLRGLAEPRTWIKWLLRHGGGSKLASAFETAAGGSNAYAALRRELEAEPSLAGLR